MYQKLIIVGRLGRDPVVRNTPNGVIVCDISVAVSEKRGGKETTAWFRASVWNNDAENAGKYLHKGSLVLVEGRLTPDENGNPRVFKKQSGEAGASYEMTADRIKYLDSKQEAEEEIQSGYDELPF